MSKPITMEMLEAMTLDQRKTLHRNALSLDTPAARGVLEMLAQNDLLGAPKATTQRTPVKTAAARKPRAKAAAPKPIQAQYGRQV